MSHEKEIHYADDTDGALITAEHSEYKPSLAFQPAKIILIGFGVSLTMIVVGALMMIFG